MGPTANAQSESVQYVAGDTQLILLKIGVQTHRIIHNSGVHIYQPPRPETKKKYTNDINQPKTHSHINLLSYSLFFIVATIH
jgi:hypothetical protein